MGFQRVCAPFGRVLRDRVPESLSAESEILKHTLAFVFLARRRASSASKG